MSGPKTVFLSNDPLTRKKWAKDLFPVILKAIEFNELIGTGSDSIVQMRTELGKGEGDEIKFGLRLPLQGEGVVGNDTVEGNEEKLRFRDFKLTIEELNHAVDTGGKMEEQRIPYDLMQEGKTGLQEWWSDKLSDMLFAHLCGDSTFKVAGKTFAQAPVEPDTNHLIIANGGTAASLDASHEASLAFLDRMKQQAEVPASYTTGYKIRPVKIDGKSYYRVILHNFVFDRLRGNMNAGAWGDMLRSAQKLGQPNVEFEYNGMLVSKSERIRATTTGEYRNVLLGAQAACIAWGGAGESKSTTMSFTPYMKDAERFVMIRGGGILGVKATRFVTQDAAAATGEDYGKIVGLSYATRLND
jgi:N4-gp56 family major capsid protein